MKDYFNFIYMEKQNFIFAYNPKVACTNWKSIMRYLNGGDDYLSAALAHDRTRSGLTFLSEIGEPLKYLQDPKVPKYAFVRNPYSRVLSAYLNKIEPYVLGSRGAGDDNTYFYKVFCEIDNYRLENLIEIQKVNFYCFLSWLANVENFHTANEHWRPQVELLRVKDVDFDFVGKLENIIQDAPELLNKMGCDITFPSQKDVRFAPTKANEKLDNYYKKQERQLVEMIYQEDFVFFSYDKRGEE
ncbi:MAG: hypothetical protein ACI83B_003633 [Sediminicola sp.]